MTLAVSTAADCSSTWSMASLRSALPSATLSSSNSVQFRESRAKCPQLLQSFFVGLSPVDPLSSLRFPDFTSYKHNFTFLDKGRQIYAMRHGKRVPKLNRPPDQRRALLRGLTTQLLKHGRIKTTRARASAMRKHVDKMITLAKDGSLHKRRQALGFIYDKQIVHALFAEVQDRYGERNGGYTRIIRTMPRRGDNAPMAYIELV